jgi:hypothetical protein
MEYTSNVGRPTKMTENVLTALKAVLEEEDNALTCTDEELFILMNRLLEPDERISYRSFQRYKQMGFLERHDSDNDLEPLFAEMAYVMREAFIMQKRALLKRIQDEEITDWRRYAWILERKSKDWRIPIRHRDQ